MKKDKAVLLLNHLKDQLPSLNLNNYEQWHVQAKSFINTFFGENSDEYEFINKRFRFVSMYSEKYQWDSDLIKNIPVARDFIERCTHTIANVGLHKPPRKNFLSRLPDQWLIAILTILLPGIFIGGTLWGKKLSDTQNIELKIENKELKEKLSRISPVPQNTNNVTSSETQPNTATNNDSNKIQDK